MHPCMISPGRTSADMLIPKGKGTIFFPRIEDFNEVDFLDLYETLKKCSGGFCLTRSFEVRDSFLDS